MASYQELQSKNVRNSIILTSVIVAITVSAGYFIGFMFAPPDQPELRYTYASIGLSIAGVIMIIQSLFAWFAGASFVLAISGAKEIGPDNTQYREVYNCVEEMKIAAGVPMPRVYIIHDHSPNAFATGRNPKDGRVAVTKGLLEVLNREELQAVIAHEIGHIKNRDILFQTIVGIMVGMIAILSDFVLRVVVWGGLARSRDNKGGGAAAVMIIGLIFAILAPIIAQLVRMAISRQREYLADASGAEFTRNPMALASALAKISGTPIKLARANHGTAHMWISDPFAVASHAAGAFSTHPPIPKRIERLMAIGNQQGMQR